MWLTGDNYDIEFQIEYSSNDLSNVEKQEKTSEILDQL
jgi:hypothetical protein